jgi:hypothetical protein
MVGGRGCVVCRDFAPEHPPTWMWLSIESLYRLYRLYIQGNTLVETFFEANPLVPLPLFFLFHTLYRVAENIARTRVPLYIRFSLLM